MKDDPKTTYEGLIDQAERFISRSSYFGPHPVRKWRNECLRFLKDNLPDSGLTEDILLISAPVASSGRGLSPSDVKCVQRIMKVLYRARDLLPLLATDKPRTTPRAENMRKIFIVHGRNETLKMSVARLLERLDLEPIILHEQPNLGRTIIEKFIDYSDVAFAVVLLTGDDRGGCADKPPESFQPRARQNVIMELGFFIGRLGRKNVVVIYEQNVEIPTDYKGVIFIPYNDSGVWQLHLAKEIKAAGIDVNLNEI